jgi:hypothetical protein
MADSKQVILHRIKQHGAAHVARVLEVSRSALLSYAAGAERDGTRCLIESRVDRLGSQDPRSAP